MRYFTAIVALLWAAPAAGQDAQTALGRAEEAYRQTTTLRAQFSQTIVNPMLRGGPLTSSGVLFLQPPSHFAMRFSDPDGDRIVADGQWLWVYAPETAPGQVMRQPIPGAGPASPNLMAQFVDHPTDRYAVAFAGTDTVGGAAVDVLTLTPLHPDLPFRSVEIAVARLDGVLRRIVVVERSGQRRTLVFSSIQRNIPLPDDAFRFVVPEGVKVVG